MDFDIKILESSKMTQKEIEDFIFVQREVFPKAKMTFDDFKLKFLDNIYGDSIIVLAYQNGEVAGARAFWRNDVFNVASYQPSDTAVRKKFRRNGLFVKMTIPILELLGGDTLVYNFPNGNSYPQYMKLGWVDFKIQYTRIFSLDKYLLEEPQPIPHDYYQWWIKPHLNDKYGYVKIMNKFFLVRKLTDKGRCIVFGQIEKEDTYDLEKIRPTILIYQSEKCPFYNRSKKVACNVVCKCNNMPKYIPNWRTDVF